MKKGDSCFHSIKIVFSLVVSFRNVYICNIYSTELKHLSDEYLVLAEYNIDIKKKGLNNSL